MSRDNLSQTEARRHPLAAQGFDRPRPGGPIGATHLRRTIRQLGLLQLDFVNVLVPAHYQVPFSRLGPYERSRLDDVVYRRREFTEQWAHEASIVPVETWPLLRHRMETRRIRPYCFEKFLEQYPEYVRRVLEEVRQRGPLTANELPPPECDARHYLPTDWYWSVRRAVLEAHFTRGLLAVVDRRPDFARAYDLAERVLPAEHHGRRVEREEAQRALLRQAGRALGVATLADLADYFRMLAREARPRVVELVESGELRPVRVEGWREQAYLHPEAKPPRRTEAAALLSPFDPLIWFRPRAQRLFDFEHRFEIFVPPQKRKWGCYVLPFLMGDRLVARVDLKADRSEQRLRVLAAHLELHAEAGPVAESLGAELRLMANWLGLDRVSVEGRRGFARTLAAAAVRV
jgi:uncharacterized protein YcaQ